MKRIAFIINPISGVSKKNNLPLLINQNLDQTKFQYEIFYTEHRGHASEISAEIVKNQTFDIVAIVGGDGSINEVGRAIVNSKIALAIIPTGSGNGYAKHFGIPCDVIESIKYLNKADQITVDSGKINDHHFFATCGLGFDARVTHRFDKVGKRGLLGYVKAVAEEIRKCTDIEFKIQNSESKIVKKAFLLTVANTSQFGNDFTISPKSNANDGQLELIMFPKLKFFELPEFLFKAFTRNLSTYKKMDQIQSFEFTIETENLKGHVDGDPISLNGKNRIQVLPKSLNLMVVK